MNKVIVIGCFVPGLSVVRALGEKNIPVVAISYSANDIAQLSRYVSEVVHIPHPEKEPERMIDCLTANGERWHGSLILESADLISIPLSQHKQTLSQHYRVVTPDWSVLNRFINKEVTYDLAEQCGVPHPKTFAMASAEDWERVSGIQFPCILKPARSFEFVNMFHVKNFKVGNLPELREKFQLCMDAGFPILLQEIIPGPDANLFKLQGYINSKGQMVGKFFHRKLRQSPPHFGVMRVGISTERYAEVEELTERLLCPVNYRGYFSIEFKKDPRDGQLKLMENNCRLPRCGMLATASGVNYPWLIYMDLVENQQVDIKEYRVGTYMIELYADLSNSLFHHREEDISLADYIRPYIARHKEFSDLDFRDMRPFWRLTEQKLNNVFRKVPRVLHIRSLATAEEAE